MQFEWDEAKRAENIRKHGIDFADVVALFSRRMLVKPDLRKDYGEPRWRGTALLNEKVVVVVWPTRLGGVSRIISVRRANRRERADFYQYLTN